ncbi:nitrous oxide reductase accessory protein NosL [Natronorubrum aibiense]|uniref:Nitrous oxide reductase accessory protein NosL n=1 Tax=Natronorubrum aibiense TaxID=348826 RepID=A0A5P9P9A5_9EURY|nr:nitrous oxide reductase accessory protein NosL [Natronorubrum aibiense]QFU84741.1 nitrous oxide reductase accessory protein NosL [Natronorubrum aibiense]
MTQRLASSRTDRRRVLFGIGTLATASLAGCLSDDDSDDPAEPIALTDGQTCDVCGMMITDQYGPAGQVFYEDGNPDVRDGPAWFDSVAELLEYAARQTSRGWTERGTFVTDYSSVEYELLEGDEALHISTHAAADDFADATECYYVADSEVQGAMGDDYLPFSARDDAETFADDHGGTVREWDSLATD